MASLPSSNGVHHGLPRHLYDAIGRTNLSKLKWMKKSPAHFQHHQVEHVDEDTDAKLRGRGVHSAVLEPERFRETYVVWDMGTRRGKDWDAFRHRNEGREILTATMHEEAMAISAAARADKYAAEYLAGGQPEATVLWTDTVPDLGAIRGYSIDCKGRIDFLKEHAIVDLKVTRDGEPEAFARQSWQLGNHVQAAWYVDGYKRATGRELPYVIVSVESEAPYVVQVYVVPEDMLDRGREEYRGYLDRLAWCRREGRYPGYHEGPLELRPPSFIENDNDATGFGLIVNG